MASLACSVRYTLTDGDAFLLVETIYSNPSDKPLEEEPADSIRADRTFTFGSDPATNLFWADDEWFRQSYGVVAPGYEIKAAAQRATLLQFVKDGSPKVTLEPGQSHTIARKIFPASSLLAARGIASEFVGGKRRQVVIARGRCRCSAGDVRPRSR